MGLRDEINGSKPIRLFISKSADELELLPEFCIRNNISLSTHSFLLFERIPFQIIQSFEIIFFASPRAVRFFLEQSEIRQNVLIAVAGESTRKYLEQRGFNVHFSPTNSGNIEESTLEFSQWVTGKKVLFPTSDRSQKSYTKKLKSDQFDVIQVYKTQISTEKIENQNIYVFTSPSNVNGFLGLNTIPVDAHVIAWGETTSMVLPSYMDSNRMTVLKQSSEKDLIELLEKNLSNY